MELMPLGQRCCPFYRQHWVWAKKHRGVRNCVRKMNVRISWLLNEPTLRYVTQSLATQLSFDPFSRLAVQRWPSVTASCVQGFQMVKNPPKISSLDVISRNFPGKFQQIHSLSVSGHCMRFILCQTVADLCITQKFVKVNKFGGAK